MERIREALEQIREAYEWGLMIQVEDLASCINIVERMGLKGYEGQITLDMYERICGYLSAGMYSGIITSREYNILSEELHRWRWH